MCITVTLSEVHFSLLINCTYVELFGLGMGIVPCYDADIYVPFVSRLVRAPLSTLSNVKQNVMPQQCSITQRPSQHSTLHTVPLTRPLLNTQIQTCLYSCCRQNINNSQLVLEVAHCCTVLILLHCEFIILYL